jgi:hypothetical protein
MIGVVDDGLCWTITSHPVIPSSAESIQGTCFNHHYTSSKRDGRSTRRASEAAHIREGEGTGSGMYDLLGKS